MAAAVECDRNGKNHIIYRSLKCDTLSHEHQILYAIEENNISYQINVVSMTNSVINTKKNGIVSGTKPRKIFVCRRPHVQWPLWPAGDKETMTGDNSGAVLQWPPQPKWLNSLGFPASRKVE